MTTILDIPGAQVAALFVEKSGCYAGLPNVDVWDESRDARTYPGPHPVVAHPPCSRWCRLAGLVKARYPHLAPYRGQDGGCFASALASVRAWGGVLEHPAYTDAFAAHGLTVPPAEGWQRAICGGWTCEVSQAHYGHRARKLTWLYAFGVELPSLRWGAKSGAVWMTWLKRDGRGREMRAPAAERMGKRERNATPAEFRDLLLSIARSACARRQAA